MTEDFYARVQAQLRLALLGDCGCHKSLAKLEDEARSSGLTGAEIDAALGGRSFEARTAAALAFACAIKAGEDGAIEQARDHAARFGVTDEELSAVAKEAKRILASTAR
jgi:hypothetical protein